MPAKQRAREAIEANPQKSDRAIAVDLGTSPETVHGARRELGANSVAPEREGRDGKVYRLPVREDRDGKTKGPMTYEQRAHESKAPVTQQYLAISALRI